MHDYMIYTYGGQDILQQVFNAIGRIFASNSTYFTPVATFSLSLGAVWAGTRAIFNGNVEIFGKQWFVPSFLALTLLFSPKTTVWLMDDVRGNAPVKIDNIPFAIGAVSSLSSRLSYSLTEMIEDHLLPAHWLKSRNTPLMFGAKAVAKIKDL